jgi:GTP cyclohydrolase I
MATKPDPNSNQRESVDLELIAQGVRMILEGIGEDPERAGLQETPQRVAEMYAELTSGMREDPSQHVIPLPGDKHDEMVIVKDIEFYSLCEHHMLPFFGKMHVAYLPKSKVIGLSKIPRIVDAFARRLQVQERLTTEVAEAIRTITQPRGVGVICEARHFCMMMRGVEKQHSETVTSAMLGAFRARETRSEFLSLVAHNSLQF